MPCSTRNIAFLPCLDTIETEREVELITKIPVGLFTQAFGVADKPTECYRGDKGQGLSGCVLVSNQLAQNSLKEIPR